MSVEAYAAQLLLETREEIARADTKAEILFATFGLGAAAVLAALLAGDWGPAKLAPAATVLFCGGGASVAAAFLALGFVLWPRVRHEKAVGPASYFGHVRAHDDLTTLRTALTHASQHSERTLQQLKVVSDIAWNKYFGIQVAMALYGFGIVTCTGAAIFG